MIERAGNIQCIQIERIREVINIHIINVSECYEYLK